MRSAQLLISHLHILGYSGAEAENLWNERPLDSAIIPPAMSDRIKNTLTEALTVLEEWELILENEYGMGRTLDELNKLNIRAPVFTKVKSLLDDLSEVFKSPELKLIDMFMTTLDGNGENKNG
jgi:hypothetical protein